MTKTQISRVKRLIAALRSGKYKQTTSKLRDSDGAFCCLGVACEISRLSKWNNIEIQGNGNNFVYLDEDAVMPQKVREYYGFLDHTGAFQSRDGIFHEYGLAAFNDMGRSFKEIAKQIEYCLKHPETQMFE